MKHFHAPLGHLSCTEMRIGTETGRGRETTSHNLNVDLGVETSLNMGTFRGREMATTRSFCAS